MKKYFIILAILASSIPGFSQHIYFCKSHKQNGEPIGRIERGYLATKFAGKQMEVLLDLGKYYKGGEVAYFYVDKLSDNGRFEMVYNSDDIKTEPDKKWVVWKITDIGEWETTGHYKFTALVGANAIVLAEVYIYIDTESTEWNPAKKK